MMRNTICIASFCWALCATSVAAQDRYPLSWAESIERIQKDAALQSEIVTLIAEAREEVQRGLVRRAYKLEEIGKNRTWLDGRSEALEDEIRERFALAMSDFSACNSLAQYLPVVAAAAVFSGDNELTDHVIAQLEEVKTWSPLQRPGWTLYAPGRRLPADGKDGNWLATGTGIRAIVTTLEIMGGRIGEPLREALKSLLEKEVVGIVDDWRTKRPWFVKGNNAITNQWVLPTEGLVRACLYLGIDERRDAYELGVKNLMQALDSHGTEGEFEEGIGYANFTLTSLVHTARAMAVAGDMRGVEHPFLKNYSTWAVHHLQPGRMTVNCFDAGNAQVPRSDGIWRNMLSLLVFAQRSEAANWALWNQFEGPSPDLIGLLSRVVSAQTAQTEPQLFANYDRARMVVWRDSWEDDASGVWVRGGHELDQHDHQDRGHVNYIHQGRAILIEAGTPGYSNPDMGVLYASGAGHNVLQVGIFFPELPFPVQAVAEYAGWQRPGTVAPIVVDALTNDGGSISVNVSSGYDVVEKWLRKVTWDIKSLTVRDSVRLNDGKEERLMFRWHLGTTEKVRIETEQTSVNVHWSDARVQIEADHRFEVRQTSMPDSTLTAEQDHQHTGLEIISAEIIPGIEMSTLFIPLEKN